jgi:hypothetical protein
MSGARVKITCNLRGNVVAGGGGGGGTSWAKDRKPSTGFVMRAKTGPRRKEWSTVGYAWRRDKGEGGIVMSGHPIIAVGASSLLFFWLTTWASGKRLVAARSQLAIYAERNALTSAANSLWCCHRKPCPASG